MTEAMPFLQKYDITFLRPPTIWCGRFALYRHISYFSDQTLISADSWVMELYLSSTGFTHSARNSVTCSELLPV